jgi:hypothetical protein
MEIRMGDGDLARHRTTKLATIFIVSVPASTLLFLLSLQVPHASSSTTDTYNTYLPVVAKNAGSGPALGGCRMFPADNVWNARIDSLLVDSRSADYINFIGSRTPLHPDFGANWNGGPFGIPFDLVPGTQPLVPINFDYDTESDPGPYPIPSDPSIEKGSDAHMLLLDIGHCILYETWDTRYAGGWYAGSGAVFDLNSNALRTSSWTSADAAGLPILPGLVRYDEVASGEIKHAIRFTVIGTNNTFIWPARHRTNHNYNANAPPMGQRFRLKSTFDISSFSPQVQVMLTAFKRYGIIVADNGSNWYISGVPDARWNDSTLVDDFNRIHGSDFEAVDESGLMIDPNSGQVK